MWSASFNLLPEPGFARPAAAAQPRYNRGGGCEAPLGRNLYILAGTLIFFSAVSYLIGFTGIAHEPGSPADANLWGMIGIVLLLLALVVALLGTLQTMFEQAERRTRRRAARGAGADGEKS